MGERIEMGKVLDTDILSMMQDEVYEVNAENGWFDDQRTFGDEMMLLVTEVAEAMEAFRDFGFKQFYRRPDGEFDDSPVSDSGAPNKPEGVASEIADVLIRVLDTCHRHDIDLFKAFREKLNYNITRGYRHGGKNL